MGKIVGIIISMVFTFGVMLLMVKIFAETIAICVGTPIGALAMCATLYLIYKKEERKRLKRMNKEWKF